jgi:hypothetical protein
VAALHDGPSRYCREASQQNDTDKADAKLRCNASRDPQQKEMGRKRE